MIGFIAQLPAWLIGNAEWLFLWSALAGLSWAMFMLSYHGVQAWRRTRNK